MNKTIKYLVTGGCGFVGSYIAHKLLQTKSELIIADNLHRQPHNSLDWLQNCGNFVFYNANITDSICEIIKEHQPDVIYHLAGQVAMTTSISNPRLDFNTNVLGTFNLLEAVRLYSPNSSIIYASTNKVYGDLKYINFQETKSRYYCDEYPLGFNEKTPLDFHSPYGCSKGAADQYVLDYSRMFGLKTIVFRHSTMYGSKQQGSFDQGWIGWFCKKAIETTCDNMLSFTINGNGKQVRDLLYIEDVVDLYIKAANCVEYHSGEVYNIGGGIHNSLSLLELFDLLEDILDIKLNYSALPPRPSDQKLFVADITKASDAFDWNPKISKREGLLKVLKNLGDLHEY